jgi:hypothetical protein
LRIGKDDIDPKIRGIWKMRFRPIDEVVRDIHIRDAQEEVKIEMARKLLAEGIAPDIIAKTSGIDKDEILSLG